MDFTPSWYLKAKAKREHVCAEDDFGDGGAIGALTKLWPWLITAWVAIGALAAAAWVVW